MGLRHRKAPVTNVATQGFPVILHTAAWTTKQHTNAPMTLRHTNRKVMDVCGSPSKCGDTKGRKSCETNLPNGRQRTCANSQTRLESVQPRPNVALISSTYQ